MEASHASSLVLALGGFSVDAESEGSEALPVGGAAAAPAAAPARPRTVAVGAAALVQHASTITAGVLERCAAPGYNPQQDAEQLASMCFALTSAVGCGGRLGEGDEAALFELASALWDASLRSLAPGGTAAPKSLHGASELSAALDQMASGLFALVDGDADLGSTHKAAAYVSFFSRLAAAWRSAGQGERAKACLDRAMRYSQQVGAGCWVALTAAVRASLSPIANALPCPISLPLPPPPRPAAGGAGGQRGGAAAAQGGAGGGLLQPVPTGRRGRRRHQAAGAAAAAVCLATGGAWLQLRLCCTSCAHLPAPVPQALANNLLSRAVQLSRHAAVGPAAAVACTLAVAELQLQQAGAMLAKGGPMCSLAAALLSTSYQQLTSGELSAPAAAGGDLAAGLLGAKKQVSAGCSQAATKAATQATTQAALLLVPSSLPLAQTPRPCPPAGAGDACVGAPGCGRHRPSIAGTGRAGA